MTRAYDKLYLDKARTALGRMLDYATHDLHYTLEAFFALFLSTDVATRLEYGDFTVTVGRSGVELAWEVLDQTGEKTERKKPRYDQGRSEEFWTGWALAYYQWATALSFANINRYVPITEVRALYSPYHEMDIRQFVDKMDELYRQAKPETNLKLRRKELNLSQWQLSELSDVPVRTIQQYEQRQKNINKAQVEYLVTLSRVLGCGIEDLLEPQGATKE